MTDRSHKHEMKDDEARVREEAEESSTREAVAGQMRRDMENKSPGQAMKDDMKAVGQDIKDNLPGRDADDEDEDKDDRA